MLFKNLLTLSLAVVLTFASCTGSAQQNTNLNTTEFEKGIKQNDIQLLDVRTPAEYQSGHLKDAFLANWNNKEEFMTRVKALDKSKPVYTYCLSGGRSGAALKWLVENGYTAYNLDGGIAAWKKDGKDVEAAANVKQITMQEYQAMIPSDKTVLVDFGAVWCPPCKVMNPIIDSLAKAKMGSMQLVKVDGGDQVEISKQLNIEALPTFIVYKNGKEVWRKTGIVDAAEIEKNLN